MVIQPRTLDPARLQPAGSRSNGGRNSAVIIGGIGWKNCLFCCLMLTPPCLCFALLIHVFRPLSQPKAHALSNLFSPFPTTTPAPPKIMRVFASIVTVAGLVAVASADLNNACPSSALLNTRGGGFFDKLDAKISSVTKSSNNVRSQGGMPSNQVVRNARHQSKRLEGADEEDLFCLPTDAFTPPFPPLQAMDKATKSIDKVSSKAQNGIDQADAKLKKVQADTEVRSKVKQKGDVEVSAAGQGQGVRRGRRGDERWPKGQCMEWKRCQGTCWKRCQAHVRVLLVLPGSPIKSATLQFLVVGPAKIPSFFLCFAHSFPSFLSPKPKTKTQAKAKKLQAEAKVVLKK
jgi:hypothetical protein